MKNAIIVTGLGFGDEAKGSVVDYICKKYKARMVVKFTGGFQCAHHVITPDNKIHCFSQIGAGAIHGAHTQLGPEFIFEPFCFERERDRFVETFNIVPRVYVSQSCLVTTPYHKFANRIYEQMNNHGSCGVGIGETRRLYLEYGDDFALTGYDISDGFYNFIYNKLRTIRMRYLSEFERMNVNSDYVQQIYDTSPQKLAKQYVELYDKAIFEVFDLNLKNRDNVVFEGSQGVLLDEYYGFHPHTTWSTTTPKYALDIVDRYRDNDTNVYNLGVIRTYMTRHGHGPMPTETHHVKPSQHEQNQTNDWQHNFRTGYLDKQLLDYALDVCGNIDGLAVTHCDQDIIGICDTYSRDIGWSNNKRIHLNSEFTDVLRNVVYKNIIKEKPLDWLKKNYNVVLESHGPTCDDKIEAGFEERIKT